jgi:hypothetical protein
MLWAAATVCVPQSHKHLNILRLKLSLPTSERTVSSPYLSPVETVAGLRHTMTFPPIKSLSNKTAKSKEDGGKIRASQETICVLTIL